MAKKIQLVIGSVREGRMADSVAEWVKAQAAKNPEIDLEVVDLKDMNLPLLAAPMPPAYAPVGTPEANKWAEVVTRAEGFIFITPEYNRGLPAVLKNALDYLTEEWKDKPALVVSYGYVDGGMSANRHLHDTLGWLKFKAVEPTVGIKLDRNVVGEGNQLNDPETNLKIYEEDLQKALSALAS